ncbi:hypothetical protein SBA_ch1_02110 [Sphingomonas bisphenolicum]|uniref:Uncharacterized protein n=1 Tax=Sphingomonas bisphenolicum TaxID=296544 RepID=A0ABM7FWW0_9SPHN|nr:hypothetical protein SBA_ch1_02110 [Sphingomonas bisphenolicum]
MQHAADAVALDHCLLVRFRRQQQIADLRRKRFRVGDPSAGAMVGQVEMQPAKPAALIRIASGDGAHAAVARKIEAPDKARPHALVRHGDAENRFFVRRYGAPPQKIREKSM